MALFYGKPEAYTFADIVQQVPDSEFNNLTRSTIPLLSYWNNPEEVIQHILEEIAPYTPMSKLCVEYPVSSGGGIGKASMTDIMFISDPISIAIEGKWNEPRYKTVGSWLDKGNRQNREMVLQGWINHIQPNSNNPLENDTFANAVYQMVHRTASVCSLGKHSKQVAVIYQIFGLADEHVVDYKQDLIDFVKMISPQPQLRFWLHTVKMDLLPRYNQLQDEFEASNNVDEEDLEERASLIREAIMEGVLFDFIDEELKEIHN